MSLNSQALLDEVEIDLMAKAHAVLESTLIVALSSLSLYVLLDRIDLRLVLNELLLNVIQAVVDVTLQDLVLLGIMLHGMIGHLLGKAGFVLLEECSDRSETHFLSIKVNFEIVCLGELVRHLVLHLSDLLCDLLHFLLDPTLQSLDLLQIILSLL